MSVYGSNLKFRNLMVPQVSGQVSISKNVVYLNDFTANLNERDYIAGHGVFSLEKPHPYSGKIFASVADLARLKPILAAAGNNNEIAGSLVIDWEGSGEAGRVQEFRKTEADARERALCELAGAPGEHRCELFARRSRCSDHLPRQRQDEFPGDPHRERFDPGNLENPDRSGHGKIRVRLRFVAVRLEKHRNSRASFSFGRESSGDISVREPGSEKAF